MSNFIKKVKAKLTGDKAELLAIANEDLATASLEHKVSELKFKLVEAKSNIKIAENKLDDAKYPTEKISTKEAFIATLLDAKNEVTKAENAVKQLQFDMDYYTAILEEYKTEPKK